MMKMPNVAPVQEIWRDRRRILGLPISFTVYSMSEDRLFVRTGLFGIREEEVLLYRVKDVSLTRSLWQRLFGVGSVCVKSADVSSPHLDIRSVRHPREVKELISQHVEADKAARRIQATEVVSADAARMAADPCERD